MTPYEARCSFLRGNFEETHTIQYEADTREEAVRSAARWVRNRQKHLPEVFGVLGCLRVSRVLVGPISASGDLFPGGAWPFFEWKVDYPISLEEALP